MESDAPLLANRADFRHRLHDSGLIVSGHHRNQDGIRSQSTSNGFRVDPLPIGSGHNAKAQYSERPDDYVNNMDRLARKFETSRKFVPKAVVEQVADAKIGFIGYGTTHWAIGESRDQLREETDVKTSYYRLRAYPFTDDLNAFIDAHERVYVIEQNRDAQLRQLMKLELTPERCAKLRSVLHYSGLPIDARSVTEDVLAQEGFEVAKKTVHIATVAGGGMTGGE